MTKSKLYVYLFFVLLYVTLACLMIAVCLGFLGPTLYILHIDDDVIENVSEYHLERFGLVSFKQDGQWYSRRYSSFYAVKQKGKV